MNLEKIGLLVFLLFTATVAKADDYYWVGDVNGNGIWDQVGNWRVNGSPASSIPASSDNVFFDRTNIHTVTLPGHVQCLNITITGAPRFTANTAYYLNIYGSASFNSTTTSGSWTGVRMAFKSNSTATLTSNGMPRWYHLIIDKEGGELTITDSIIYEYVDFLNGKLIFAPNSIAYIERFRSSVTLTTPYNIGGILTVDSDRTLILNNTTIKGKREWKYAGVNATLDAGTSIIDMSANDNVAFEFYGSNQTVYNQILMTNTAPAYSGNTLTFLLNAKYFKFDVADLTHANTPLVRLYGKVNDSVRIEKTETNMRLDFSYAVIDSAVFKTINSTMAQNRSHIKNAYLEGSAFFQDDIKIDTLTLSYGQYYSFNQNQKYTIFENYTLLGDPCSGPIVFQCGNSNVNNMAELIKTSGSLDILYGRIINMKTSGGATFHFSGFNDNAIGWNFTDYVVAGKDLHWIGGGMYRFWHDPSAWSLTSGGEPAHCVPSEYDNVYFGNNSNISTNPSNNKHIRIRGGLRPCMKDLNFIGDAGFMPNIFLGARGVDVYGSLHLTPGMTFQNIQSGDTLRFLSSGTGNTVTTNKTQLMRIVFRNPTGEWILQDTLRLYSGHNLLLHSGTLNTNDQSVYFYQFYSEGNLPRSLILGASHIHPLIRNTYSWYFRGTNMTLDAGSSIFHLTDCSITSDSTLQYNRIINIGITYASTLSNISAKYVEMVGNPLNSGLRTYLEGVGKIDSLVVYRTAEFRNGRGVTIGNAQLLGPTLLVNSNTFDTITFGDGTTNHFSQGSTQRVRSKAQSISTGCNGYSYFSAILNLNASLIPTATAKIEITPTETFHINGANIRWMEGLGTGTYSVAGEDLGNNINWVFTPPTTKELYWVGGSGDWHDKAHWSASSGGAGGFCLPTEYDNITFDANSNLIPSDSLVVFVDDLNVAKCRNMTWTGTQGVHKSLYVENNLYVYGSLDLQKEVEYLVRYFRLYALPNFTPQTIKSNGATLYAQILFGEVNKETLGYWTLLDKLSVEYKSYKVNNGNITLPGHIQVYGTFDTDGNDIDARLYMGRPLSTTYWRDSKITITYLAAEGNTVCGFLDKSIAHVDSSHFIIYVQNGANTQIYGGIHSFNNITVLNQYINDVNLHGAFSANHVYLETGIYTYIRNRANIKRVDAPYGLRCVQSVTIDTLNIGTGEYLFWPDQTSNIKIIKDSPFICSQYRYMASASGVAAKINIGETMSLTNTEFKNLTVSGAGIPYAVTGLDLGGNTGLQINAPAITDMYLVSDTTFAYWDNPNVWSFTSGGPPAGCIPGRWNNVYVDDNSYIKNPASTLQLRTGLQSIVSKCYHFTSSRSNLFQMYSERNHTNQSLWVYGSIDFNSKSQMVMEHDNSPLYLKAETPQTLHLSYIRGRTFFDGTGSWTLLNDFVVDSVYSKTIYFRSGDLKLNGHRLSAIYINEDAPTNYSIDIKNSTMVCTHLLILKSVIHNPEGSKLHLTNKHNNPYLRTNNAYSKFDTVIFHFYNGGNSTATIQHQLTANVVNLISNITNTVKLLVHDSVKINDFKTVKNTASSVIDSLRFDKSSTFGSFYSEANRVAMYESNTFDSVVIAPSGPIYTFKEGTTQTITKALYMSGSPCKITRFFSSSPGSLATIIIPRPMTVDFMEFAYIKALSYDGTPGNVLTAERNSSEVVGSFNENILFITAPKTVVGLGLDLTACFKSFPYTISSDGFFAGPAATYQWRNSSNQLIGTDKDLVITTPGKYSVKVNYDPLYTCVQDDEVTILKALPISPVKSYDTVRPVCHKDSIVLTVKTPLGDDFKYSLQDTTNHSPLSFQTSPVFEYVKAGVYYLVADSLSCPSDSLLVMILEPHRSGIPNDIIINDTAICLGTPATLEPETSIGLNPVFKWYLDEDLTSELIAGVEANGKFTTPPLTSLPVTYYVTISSDSVCENLQTKAKPVTISVTEVDCLKAVDDTIYVFACDSVTSNVAANDHFHSGDTVSINILGMPLKGDINLENNHITYINTTCIGAETDEYSYALCSEYVCDTASVRVYILKVPEILLVDSCSFKPYMVLDMQYSPTFQWLYSPDNSPGSWIDLTSCENTICAEMVEGFYKAKVLYLGMEVYTLPKELIILQKRPMPGNTFWYQTAFN